MRVVDFRWSIWAFILIFPAVLFGQGLIVDDELYNKLPRQPIYNDGSKSENDVLRNVPKVDLRPYCPVPQHQGAISSCTGWATGYGAMTILEAIRQKKDPNPDSIRQIAFSALFVYNQVKAGGCDAGADIGKAAALLRDHGNVLSKEFDLFKNNCDKQPDKQELQKALANRIKDYVTLFATDDARRIKIEKTKLSIAQKKPVVIGMLLRNNFQNVRRGDQFWFPDTGDTTFLGAHAMVVVGYDDGKEAFEIMNSWGPSWGNNGFVWVKYNDYARFCCYGFQFIPYEDPTNNRLYEASIQLRSPVYDAYDNLQFENVEILAKGKYYEFRKKVVPRDYLVQINVQQVTEGAYLYVFSYDPKGSIKVHWPRDEKFDSNFTGKNESALIAVPSINLLIPSENSVLRFETSGAEYICILIAKEPVSNFNNSLNALQSYPTNQSFFTNLYTAFGKNLLPLKDIDFLKDKIGFSNTIESGKAVPIVLKVNVR